MELAKTVAFYTLGCKLNYAETDAIAQIFEKEGYCRGDFKNPADVYVINTCSVTETANSKSRYTIRTALKQNPTARIVVVGCYAQLKPEEIAKIEGVDLVLGTNEKFKIIERLAEIEQQTDKVARIYSCEIEDVEHYNPSYSLGSRTRSFLKVQDGCDYKCSYCTIPYARGKSRNPKIEAIVEQAKDIAAQGVHEIVLTGINIGDFGKSTGDSFYDLIKALDRVDGVERYRISSIEPNLLSEGIIKFVASSEKFMPHFHIPLQSGSDAVLELMKRRYNTSVFASKLRLIKRIIPHAAIGIDVIVGTPGELPEYFIEAYEFLQKQDFSYLHVFTYSPREGTEALAIEPKVTESDKKVRSTKLHALSDEKQLRFYEANIGKTALVLFEGKNEHGMMSGFTANHVRVEVPYNKSLINTIKSVHLKNLTTSGKVAGVLV